MNPLSIIHQIFSYVLLSLQMGKRSLHSDRYS